MAPSPNGRDYERERHQRNQESQALGHRLRKTRLAYGLTREQVAQGCGISPRSYVGYELGSQAPRPWRLAAIAGAIGCPIASLFVDAVVLAELRVSEETLERVRREGQPAADDVAQRIASTLSPLLLAEATRPPVDLRPGARPRKRRDRAQVLAGVSAAKAAAAARVAREAAAGEIT